MELKEVWQRFALFDPSLASDHIKDPHQLPFIEKRHISAGVSTYGVGDDAIGLTNTVLQQPQK